MSDKLKNKEIKVLLIEDDEEDYLLTKDVLSRIKDRRYKLDWVSTYELGHHELREGKYDAYLIDNRLGAESGLDLISTAVSECMKYYLTISSKLTHFSRVLCFSMQLLVPS